MPFGGVATGGEVSSEERSKGGGEAVCESLIFLSRSDALDFLFDSERPND